MRVRIEDIEAFLSVVELGSFNQAASELSITQPALSRRLSKLEEFLGCRLLDRTTRAFKLTAVGEEFVPLGKRMVKDFEGTLEQILDIIQVRSGNVTFTCNPSVSESLLPEVLVRFHHAYPEVRVRVIESASSNTTQFLVNGEAEFAIGQQTSDREDIEFEPLLEDRYVLACNRTHQLAAAKVIEWRQLEGSSIFKLGSSKVIRPKIERILDELNLSFSNRIEITQLSALLGLVRRDLGVAVVPRLSVQFRPDLELAILPLANPSIHRKIGMLKLAGRTMSPAAAAIRQIVRDVLREEHQRWD